MPDVAQGITVVASPDQADRACNVELGLTRAWQRLGLVCKSQAAGRPNAVAHALAPDWLSQFGWHIDD